MTKPFNHLYEFGEFKLDPAERQLRRGEEVRPLTPKAFDLLLLLVRNHQHALTKEELLAEVWKDSVVEEKNLADNISVLRKALGDDVKEATYIETIPRYGYRFRASVQEIGNNDLVVAESVKTRVLIEEKEVPRKKSRFAWVLVGLLLIGAASTYFIFTRNRPQPQFKSLAVLPLKPLGGTSSTTEDSYLGPGLTDALITRLSSVHQIAVRPTSAVLKYASSQPDLATVAREQQVDAVLDGSYQRLGDRLRVTVQLVKANDGGTLWAETFDEKLTDLFTVQDAIASRVTAALKLRLTTEEAQRIAKKQTTNSQAYQLYLRGRYNWGRRTPESVVKALEYLNQAVQVDPEYALAYAALADAYAVQPEYANAPLHESMTAARSAAEKALSIDPTLAEAYVALAYVKYGEWDWQGIEDEYRRGLQLNPNYATGHQWYSEYLVYVARHDEALREIRTAQQLDPLSLIVNTRIGMTLYFARRYDEAIAELKKALEFSPDFSLIHVFLYASYYEKGMHRESIPHIVKGFFNPSSPQDQASVQKSLELAFTEGGKVGLWMKVRDSLQNTEKRDYHYPYSMAETNMRIGDKDEAFRWLKLAAEIKHPALAGIKVEPAMDVLRNDPRFAELLRQVNLP